MGGEMGQGRIHGGLLLAEHMRQPWYRVIVIIRRHRHPAGWLVVSAGFGRCLLVYGCGGLRCVLVGRGRRCWIGFESGPVSAGGFDEAGELAGSSGVSDVLGNDLAK